MIPSLEDAATDPELQPRDVQLLTLLAFELDVVRFNEVKETYLAKRLDVSADTIARSMARLLASGYLEREDGEPGQPNRYRIVHAHPPAPVRGTQPA